MFKSAWGALPLPLLTPAGVSSAQGLPPPTSLPKYMCREAIGASCLCALWGFAPRPQIAPDRRNDNLCADFLGSSGTWPRLLARPQPAHTYDHSYAHTYDHSYAHTYDHSCACTYDCNYDTLPLHRRLHHRFPRPPFAPQVWQLTPVCASPSVANLAQDAPCAIGSPQSLSALPYSHAACLRHPQSVEAPGALTDACKSPWGS